MTLIRISRNRNSPKIPVFVNGAPYDVPVGVDTDQPPEVIAALDSARITYRLGGGNGISAGMLEIRGTGKQVAVGLNGVITYFPVGTEFPDTPANRALLDTSNISYLSGGTLGKNRVATTRGQVMNNATLVGGPGQSNYNRFETRVLKKTGADGLINPSSAFTGFYYNVPETAQPTNAAVELGYEYGGITKMATFGGSPLGTIVAGTPIYFSDTTALTIPPYTEYFERSGLIVPSGAQYMLGGVSFPGIGEACYLSTSGVSQVNATGALVLPSGGVLSGSHGGAVFTTSTGVKTTKAALVLGDSLFSAKGFDNTGDGHGNIGFIKPALWAAAGGPYPFADYARSSGDAAGYAASTGWRSSLDYVDVMICDLGTNDLNQAAAGNYTLANIQANLMTIWAAAKAKGVKVHQMIIWPRTTSTGNTFTDAAGQTPRARFGVGQDRDLLNAWIRSMVGTLIDGVIDLLATVEDQGVPGVWKTTGVANATTIDGTHPSQAYWRLLQAVMTALVQAIMT
jgi:hypothetical protein